MKYDSSTLFLGCKYRAVNLEFVLDAPVAQLDRASDFESEGRRFESCRVYHYFFPFEILYPLTTISDAINSPVSLGVYCVLRFFKAFKSASSFNYPTQAENLFCSNFDFGYRWRFKDLSQFYLASFNSKGTTVFPQWNVNFAESAVTTGNEYVINSE